MARSNAATATRHDLRAENLIQVERGPRPFIQGRGGKASALAERQARNTTLLNALATHPDATVPQLSRLIGASESCTCVRLAKLETQGLTCSPKCQAHIRWRLSQAGSEFAATGRPVIDGVDRDILAALALVPMGTMKLSRRVGACAMTIKRRINLMVARGLVFADPRKFFSITDEGRAALGPNNPPRPAPWLRPEQVSAAVAKDVLQRHGQEPDDRSAAFRAKVASLGAQASAVTARLRKRGRQPFSALSEFDRLAG